MLLRRRGCICYLNLNGIAEESTANIIQFIIVIKISQKFRSFFVKFEGYSAPCLVYSSLILSFRIRVELNEILMILFIVKRIIYSNYVILSFINTNRYETSRKRVTCYSLDPVYVLMIEQMSLLGKFQLSICHLKCNWVVFH